MRGDRKRVIASVCSVKLGLAERAMDADASPLVQADQLAAQGEQLASRRAFQQAVTAHTASARQYQAAAQAISDLGAAKALLLQRDRQLKLAADSQRKLTSSAGTVTAKGAQLTRRDDHGAASGRPISVVAGRAGPSGLPTQGGAAVSIPARRQPGVPSSPSSPASNVHALSSTASGYNGLYRQTTSYVPPSRSVIDRIDSSVATMADSRYSRQPGVLHTGFGNSSPSASTISSSTYAPSRGTNSSDESGKASGVEESYYLMRNDHDPDDPMSAFLARIDNMVEEMGNNAVAFASAPLFMPNGADGEDHSGDGSALPLASQKQASPEAASKSPRSGVQDSFYVVPQATPAAGSSARARQSSSSGSSVSKTHEELLAENATLKENLDQLTKQMHWLSKERQRDREAMKGSMTLFARDVKKQAEKVMMHQSTASLLPLHGAASRRQMPPLAGIAPQSSDDGAQRRIAQLEQELRAVRNDLDKQVR